MEPGACFADKYIVERVLGAGGMGCVLAATHLHLEERVAVKVLLPRLASDPTLVRRFLREGRAAVKIRNEHVARVMDVDTTPEGRPYLVMEYLEGVDLGTLVRRRGPLEVAAAVDYVLQACEALAEAHALGIVHRDLKPANIFLSADRAGQPLIKILDFGVSKLNAHAPSPHDPSLTGTGAIFGSPLYMAPEQMRASRRVDARADLWALGATFFQLLTGVPPYRGDTLTEIIAAILEDAPPSLRAHRPEVPAELDAVVARCLAREVDRRYGSVADLANDLRPFASSAGLASVERILRTAAPTSTALPVQAGPSSTRLRPGAGPDSARLHLVDGARTEPAWAAESRPPPTVGRVWAYATLGALLCAGASFTAAGSFGHRPSAPPGVEPRAVPQAPPAAHVEPPSRPLPPRPPPLEALGPQGAAALVKPAAAPPSASAPPPTRPPSPRPRPAKPASTLANDRHG
jgi:serine/threonine-protein kinase